MKNFLIHLASLMVAAQMCEVLNANSQEETYIKLFSFENQISKNTIKTLSKQHNHARKGTVLQSPCTPITA